MRITRQQIRSILREELIREEISTDAPAGETIKGWLDDFEMGGMGIDELQSKMDATALAADGITVGSALTGVGAPVAAVAGGVSMFLDATNAAMYLGRGEWVDGLISLMGIIPVAGAAGKITGKAAGPLLKTIIGPAAEIAAKAGKGADLVSPMKKVITSLDPKILQKMDPGELVALQQQVNRYGDRLVDLIDAIKKADVQAFAKATGQEVPKLLEGVAEKALKVASDYMPNSVVEPAKGIIKFFQDPRAVDTAIHTMEAHKAAMKGTLKVQKVAAASKGIVGKALKANRVIENMPVEEQAMLTGKTVEELEAMSDEERRALLTAAMEQFYVDYPEEAPAGAAAVQTEGRKMRITRRQLRRIIREAAEAHKAGVFGSGMEQADLDKEKEELIGHT